MDKQNGEIYIHVPGIRSRILRIDLAPRQKNLIRLCYKNSLQTFSSETNFFLRAESCSSQKAVQISLEAATMPCFIQKTEICISDMCLVCCVV